VRCASRPRGFNQAFTTWIPKNRPLSEDFQKWCGARLAEIRITQSRWNTHIELKADVPLEPIGVHWERQYNEYFDDVIVGASPIDGR